MSRFVRVFGVTAMMLACLSGCARDSYSLQWDATAEQAERFYLKGNYSQALDTLHLLQEKARADKDRYYVAMKTGDCLLKLEDFSGARDAYYGSAHFAGSVEQVAKAMFRVARVIYTQDPEQGLNGFTQVLAKYPDTLWAQRSVDYVSAHYDALPETLQDLVSLYRSTLSGVAGTGVEGYLRYELAQRLERLGDEESLRQAVSEYDAIVGSDKSKALWDDALYAKSQILGKLEMFSEELDVHRKILQSRTEAYLFGNYETTYYHRSQFRIAELLLGPLNKRAEGIAALRTFVAEYSYSRKYDDALYLLAVYLYEDGNKDEGGRVLDRLVKERPESRYVRRVTALKETGRDPGPAGPWSSRSGVGGQK